MRGSVGFRNRSVSSHNFAMVPRADVPRSRFKREWGYKTMFNSGDLVPFMAEEILPGDSVKMNVTALCRLQPCVTPFFDNLHLEFFFFFVPNRLIWDNWVKMCGEQTNPGDSTSYTVPQITSPTGGWIVGSIADYMGLPTVGQVGGANTITHGTLQFRAYYACYDAWFRDENLVASSGFSKNDGPDGSAIGNNVPRKRGKRHDYFTSALPWVQKGTAVPIGTQAPVRGLGFAGLTSGGASTPGVRETGNTSTVTYTYGVTGANLTGNIVANMASSGTGAYPNIYADMSAVTINALRLSVQTQKLLERDARGGTRYIEVLLAHFGVRSPDYRLQRPEYLGGGHQMISVDPVPQTSASAVTGSTTPMGSLAATAAGVSRAGFAQSFTEHGWLIGIVSVRGDMSYQQGIPRKYSRLTRFDHYWPAFASLGEQPIYNKEIFADGSVNDSAVFGYQERWAEYRYGMSQVTGRLRSTAATPLDSWHLAQKFATLPALNQSFIEEAPPVSRVVAVTSQPEFFFDSVIESVWVRPMPMYSVPGLMDHF